MSSKVTLFMLDLKWKPNNSPEREIHPTMLIVETLGILRRIKLGSQLSKRRKS